MASASGGFVGFSSRLGFPAICFQFLLPLAPSSYLQEVASTPSHHGSLLAFKAIYHHYQVHVRVLLPDRTVTPYPLYFVVCILWNKTRRERDMCYFLFLQIEDGQAAGLGSVELEVFARNHLLPHRHVSTLSYLSITILLSWECTGFIWNLARRYHENMHVELHVKFYGDSRKLPGGSCQNRQLLP